MLGEILLQLAAQVVLVALELLAIARRQVDRVFVGHVDAGHGDVAVLVHLLRKLPRELDRLHVRPEGATEDTLEQGFDLSFD